MSHLEREAALGPWLLPPDLEALHNEVIEFAIAFHIKANDQHAKQGQGPLSYKALERLHRTAIVTHRSVKSLCVAGWTPTTPTLLRTMLDLLVSMVAIAEDGPNSEFMGFRFLAHGLLEGIVDPDFTSEQKANNQLQVDVLKGSLSPSDVLRTDEMIASYEQKVPPYWYWPETSSPGNAIREKMPRLMYMWKTFCGSTHGSDIGAVVLADNPDYAGINPEENPLKTRVSTVMSSRFLLDISHARSQFEGVADGAEYLRIVRDFIKPQEAKNKK